MILNTMQQKYFMLWHLWDKEKYIKEYGEAFPLTLSTMTREIQMHYIGSFVLPNNEHLADADICTRDVEFWEHEEKNG